MLQCVVDAYPIPRAERQALLHQVDCQRVRVREERPERAFLAERKRADVFTRSRGGDRVEVVDGGCPEDVEDQRELVVVCAVPIHRWEYRIRDGAGCVIDGGDVRRGDVGAREWARR